MIQKKENPSRPNLVWRGSLCPTGRLKGQGHKKGFYQEGKTRKARSRHPKGIEEADLGPDLCELVGVVEDVPGL